MSPAEQRKRYGPYSEHEGVYEPEGPGVWLTRNAGVVALLVAVFVQTSGIIWWASGVSDAAKALAATNDQQNVSIEKLSVLVESNAERLTRVQVIQENVVKILDQISQRQIRMSPGLDSSDERFVDPTRIPHSQH